VTANNTTGFKCVSRHFNRFAVAVSEGDTTKYLGTFDTAEEAALSSMRGALARRWQR
jgi:hypothetical protein